MSQPHEALPALALGVPVLLRPAASPGQKLPPVHEGSAAAPVVALHALRGEGEGARALMAISVERARAILGREADNLSDDQLARACRELDDYARLLVRMDKQRQAGQAEQERGVA